MGQGSRHNLTGPFVEGLSQGNIQSLGWGWSLIWRLDWRRVTSRLTHMALVRFVPQESLDWEPTASKFIASAQDRSWTQIYMKSPFRWLIDVRSSCVKKNCCSSCQPALPTAFLRFCTKLGQKPWGHPWLLFLSHPTLVDTKSHWFCLQSNPECDHYSAPPLLAP